MLAAGFPTSGASLRLQPASAVTAVRRTTNRRARRIGWQSNIGLGARIHASVKICESCINRRIIPVDQAPMGVNPDNRRVDESGVQFYLFSSYFYSYPSANMR